MIVTIVYVCTAEWQDTDPWHFEIVGVYMSMESALRSQDTFLRVHFQVPDDELVEELRCAGVQMRIEQLMLWR